ncbi:MAG: rRNA pseudouridine synthase [Candidatus Omnitrophica bacterium]|nr:rRNA pseudouridine synthase [Candidatus Omnitrophota bacterium]
MKKRLQTILAHAGIASRRRAVEIIESGRVKVDGEVIREKGFKADPEKNNVSVDGAPLQAEEKKYYFLLNKPKNVISTAKDTHERRKITDFFNKTDARLYPVGRLDRDTTGAIIITNDGELAHKLAHPSFEIEKEYTATVEGAIREGDVKRIAKGIAVEGRKTSPCEIKLVQRDKSTSVYKLKLHEGRKRQIRRMFEEAGGKVVKLKRVKYAGLTLKGLREGEYRKLTDREIERLKGLK